MCNKVYAISHSYFNEMCEKNKWNDDTIENVTDKVFISIIGTEDVLKYYLHEEDTTHWFKQKHSNVLNLEFDDVDKDIEFHNHKAYALTIEQAKTIVNFIEENIGKEIIIHCRAGVSRSGAVCQFIMSNYEEYKDSIIDNQHIKPNVDVLSKLNNVLWKRHFLKTVN